MNRRDKLSGLLNNKQNFINSLLEMYIYLYIVKVNTEMHS